MASSNGFWGNNVEALGILNPLLALNAPSKEALTQLSSIEPYDGTEPADSDVAATFLQAAAKHILIAHATEDQTGVKALIDKVAELSGKAASICCRRSSISKSGILLTFATLYDHSLSPLTVEFLRCALLAGQYRYAERVIADDWPRPAKGATVELVLRYFYMRGMVHAGCDHFQLAIRCFWTTVSIPSDTASAIAVDAWKKMVLAKCFVLRDSLPCQSLVSPPAGASNSISRFLTDTATATGNAPESTTSDADSVGISKYIDLVKSCHACDRRKFAQVHRENAALWENDRNTGLVERLVSDLEHRQVLQLASVYNSLPLSQLSAELELSEEDAFSTLKQVDGLNFRYENGMVWFEAIGACPIAAEDARSLIKLSETIRKLDASIATSSRYQSIKVESGKPPRGVDDF